MHDPSENSYPDSLTIFENSLHEALESEFARTDSTEDAEDDETE